MDLSNIVITLIHQSSLTLEAHATKINKLIESYKDLSKEKDSLVETAKSELADLQTKRKQITELSELLSSDLANGHEEVGYYDDEDEDDDDESEREKKFPRYDSYCEFDSTDSS